GLARQQSDLTLAALDPLPQAVQLMKLILPADKACKIRRMDGGEATFGHSFPQDPPRHYRLGEPLEFEWSHLFAHEHIAKQSQGAAGYDGGAGGRHALQAGR